MILRELLADRLEARVLDTLAPVEEPAGAHRLVAPGAEALSTWRALRAAVERTGHWPLLVGAETDEAPARPPAEREAALLAARDVTLDLAAPLEPAPKLLGSWPTRAAPVDHFSIPRVEGTDDPLPKVALLLLPTLDGAEVPAWLQLAGPAPAIQVAALRRWRRLFEAEVVGLRGATTLELTVARPPRSREAALTLAWEQHRHCPNVVTQGTFTVSALAGRLLGARAWSLWW